MEELYDDFGNYIGLDLDDDDEEEEEEEREEEGNGGYEERQRQDGREGSELGRNGGVQREFGEGKEDEDMEEEEEEEEEDVMTTAVVLHEDKKYYPSAEEIYGPGTETILQDEDAQPLEEPIVAPSRGKSFEVFGGGGGAGGGAPASAAGRAGDKEAEEAAAIAKSRMRKGMSLGAMNVDVKYLRSVSLRASRGNRHVCVAGHLHHGKTSLVDVCIEQTHDTGVSMEELVKRPPRYTDNRFDEQERGITMKCKPVSLVMESARGKSHMFTFIDSPGHPNYVDEVAAAMRLSDGVLLVVDAVEGVMMATEMAIKQAAIESLPLMLVLSKVDRLITELKLPPNDAYHKLRHTIMEVNALIAREYRTSAHASERSSASNGTTPTPMTPQLDPAKGNVAFSSGLHGWSFTLKSFADLYAHTHGVTMDTARFAKKLWGDLYFDPRSRKFERSRVDPDASRSFVSFVLEPLYKIYSSVIGEDAHVLKRVMAEFGAKMRKAELGMDVLPLLRLCCTKVFGDSRGLADMILDHTPSVRDGNAHKVNAVYTGPVDAHRMSADPVDVGTRKASATNAVGNGIGNGNGAKHRTSTGASPSARVEDMYTCNPGGKLMVMVSKMYPRASSALPGGVDGDKKVSSTSFDALGRVMSGTLRVGQQVRVLGEGYTPDDDEDSMVQTVTDIVLYNARYRVRLDEAVAGSIVLIGGVDKSIFKTATLCAISDAGTGGARDADSDDMSDDDDDDDDDVEEAHIFRPLQFVTSSIVKIATEPLNPAELPKMVDGLRSINKTYPLCTTKVEESGEHTIMGTGELYLDSLMRDLRESFSDVEIKVADPVVSFCETVVETSSLKCSSETPNGRNRITMIAEPLDKGLAEDIEAGKVNLSWPKKKVGTFFSSAYSWDLLAARSVWAFGPDFSGPNLLMDDTLPGEVDKSLLSAIKTSVVQGFQWASREGPLCDEPMRGVKLKLLDAAVADEPLHRSGGQIIPTARRVVYSSFLTATPRMMEPILRAEITTPTDCMSAIYNVISRRRGHVTADVPNPGTPLYTVRAFVPAIESFGFETDLRYHTQGQGFGLSVFDHWAVAPGDPLDSRILLRPLEPAPPLALAREFMIKTRRRKGMSEDVGVSKYLDADQLDQLRALEEN